ncbi:hypothetical protein D3C75_1344140 [compost metagenome]
MIQFVQNRKADGGAGFPNVEARKVGFKVFGKTMENERLINNFIYHSSEPLRLL